MAPSQISEVMQHLRRTVLPCEGAGLSDSQLLADYLNHQDEAAMATLVHRHGPMIWGVCRRVLRNLHDAEDAFQATFLVFVRKAASIVPRTMVANWLYGVAQHTALKARATAARRRHRERQLPVLPEPAAADPNRCGPLHGILDETLSRLPDKYRIVLVLCDLEEKTRKEVAEQLGCPEGTVAGRLARARVMLAKRLAREGLIVSPTSLVAVLTAEGAMASIPPSLVVTTTRAATLFAIGQGTAVNAIPGSVKTLTEGVLKTMVLTRIKTIASVVLVVLLGVAALGGFLAHQASGQPATKSERQPEKPAEPGKAEPQELLTVGKWYNFQISGKDTAYAKVVQKRSDGWIKVQITTQTVDNTGKRETRNQEFWLNLQQVSMIEEVAPPKP
jgi:RNA polymerase sigma factor (sigma-70 family)